MQNHIVNADIEAIGIFRRFPKTPELTLSFGLSSKKQLRSKMHVELTQDDAKL